MSGVLVKRLAEVKDEFEVARTSTKYLQNEWPHLHSHPSFETISMAGVRRTVLNLEATYIIRLFTSFESMLRDFLPQRHSNQPDRRHAINLINLTASRLHITTSIRDEVQRVREYRNQAVHQGEIATTALVFADALAALNRFLSWLPNPL